MASKFDNRVAEACADPGSTDGSLGVVSINGYYGIPDDRYRSVHIFRKIAPGIGASRLRTIRERLVKSDSDVGASIPPSVSTYVGGAL